MHLALASTGGHRRSGFREAGRRLRTRRTILSPALDMSAFLQSVTRDWDTTACVQRVAAAEVGRHHMLAMRCRSDACARAVALRKERGALPAIPTANTEYDPCSRSCTGFRLGRLHGGCEWLELTEDGGVGGVLDFLSDYRDIPMS